MPYLVDGDNLLGSWPGRARSDPERNQLAAELSRCAVRIGKRIVVVFDGASGPAGGAHGDVRYAGAGRDADSVILALLREAQDPAGWTVVTSDRALADRSRWLGARSERSDLFRKRLLATGTQEKPEREADVAYWLSLFNGS